MNRSMLLTSLLAVASSFLAGALAVGWPVRR
jgi:hypothetical protein